MKILPEHFNHYKDKLLRLYIAREKLAQRGRNTTLMDMQLKELATALTKARV